MPKWDAVPNLPPKLGGTYNKGMGQPSTSIWYQIEDGEAWGFQPMGNPKPHQTISALDATRCSPPVPGRQAGEGDSQSQGAGGPGRPPAPVGVESPRANRSGTRIRGNSGSFGPGLSVAVHRWPVAVPSLGSDGIRWAGGKLINLVPITQHNPTLGLGGGMHQGDGARRRGRFGKASAEQRGEGSHARRRGERARRV